MTLPKISKDFTIVLAILLVLILVLFFLPIINHVDIKETMFIVPANYDGQKELPVVVWLHGWGGNPWNTKFVFQRLADLHQIGFVGVSGTKSMEEGRFEWTENVEADYERVRLALAEARERIRFRLGGTVALGFSQGAPVAMEVTLRHPDIFAGAITVSAGTTTSLHFLELADKTAVHRQGFVIMCGAKESKSSVRRSKEIADWLKNNKANVLVPDYPEHETHSFPTDFAEKLPEWLAFIEKARTGER